MNVGTRIKKLRKEMNLTQAEFAKKANISRTYLSDIENNRYNPSIDTLQNIANHLGVSLEEFFSESDEKKKTPSILEGANENTLNFFKKLEDAGLFREDMTEEEINYLINIIRAAMNRP